MLYPHATIAEHHVQFAFRHYLRHGDTAFDVGANRGWLTVPMSRLIGPKGHLVSFEASPRNVRALCDAVSYHHLTNTEVVPAAVYSESGNIVQLYENRFSNTDSIYFTDGESDKVDVISISLDDFSYFYGLRPSFIKMDIEGAEYDALLGATRIIEDCLPVFVLELRAADARPLKFLLERGYKAINLRDLSYVDTLEVNETSSVVEDFLFVHPSDPRGLLTLPSLEENSFTPVPAAQSSEGQATILRDLPVAQGLNAFRLYSDGSYAPEVEISVLLGSRCVTHYRGEYYLVCRPFISFIVYSESDGTVDVAIDVVKGGAPLEITRVERRAVPLDAAGRHHHGMLNVLHPFGLGVDGLDSKLTELVEGHRQALFSLFREHLSKGEPSHPRLLYLSGTSALHEGSLTEALEFFDRAAICGFDAHWTNYMRMLALQRLGRIEEAVAAALKAKAANPNNPHLNAMLESLQVPAS